jgi:hypothetical protein
MRCHMAHAALLAALALSSVLLGGDYSLANQGGGDNADLIMEMSKDAGGDLGKSSLQCGRYRREPQGWYHVTT